MDSTNYTRGFCSSVMEASPAAMTAILGAWATKDAHACMLGLIEDLESGDAAERYGAWLRQPITIVVKADERPQAVAKHLMQAGTDNISYMSNPAELLAAAFWPARPKGTRAKDNSNEVPLSDESRALLVRIGRALQKIQDEQGHNTKAPFDHFVGHCMIGVRDKVALDGLLDLGPDWHRELKLERRRMMDAVATSVGGTLAQVGAIEGNPSAIQVVCDRVSTGKEAAQRFNELAATLAGRELHDRRASPEALVDILRSEFRRGTASRAGSMACVLADTLQQATEVDRNHMLLEWTTNSFYAAAGEEKRREGSLAVAKYLWSLTPANFADELESRAVNESGVNRGAWTKDQLDRLVSLAAACAFLPALQAFEPRVLSQIENDRGSYSTSKGSITRSFVTGILGEGSEIPIADFVESGRFLSSKGCDFNAKVFDKGNRALHLAAAYSSGPVLQTMLALVEEFGCDPEVRNEARRKPATTLDKSMREQWEAMLRSNTAKHAAQDALNELSRDMRP